MKPNTFLITIAAALTALVGYSVYSYSIDARKEISTIIFSFTFFIYSAMLLGFKMNYPKAQVLKNTMSVVFTFYSLIINFLFFTNEYSIPAYLLINIAPLLIYVAIINFFSKANF